ncbi:alpha/beta hydrolase [Halobacteriales archaeon QS_4_62_28]|nr:MAG: alpha/beta hydrolase [Halobacteriales archaeon QS_4_62_28]
MVEIYDHNGDPVSHGREVVNEGIRLHYVTAGSGEPLLLLHGTPKTHYYWHKLVPQLSEDFTVVAPDLRGFGDSDRPVAEEGYDVKTNAQDMADLMSSLGHDEFHVHGEDRGAEFGYGIAAMFPDRVNTLSFAEMVLSGEGLLEWSYLTKGNLEADEPWLWHISFFWLDDYPEMLISGKEREFWSHWMKAETYNPAAISDEAIDEWITKAKEPGGLRGILETYRATMKNAEQIQELKQDKIEMPILTVGSEEFFGNLMKEQMEIVSEGVERNEVFEQCGHSLALEADDRLATLLTEFMRIN